MVFVNGIFSPDISDVGDLPDGVVISNLVIGATSGSESLAQHLGSLAPLEEHPFAALNSALVTDGALIHVPTGVELDKIIQLVFVSGGDDRSTVSAPRILVVAEENSRATIIEYHLGNGASLSCPVSEIVLNEKAALDHVIVQEEDLSAHHLAVRQMHLASGARYSGQAISLGGALARTDIGVVLDGEDAEASLDGLYLGDGRQQADTGSKMIHLGKNTSSTIVSKGISAAKGQNTYRGLVKVGKKAENARNFSQCDSMLLGDRCRAHTFPYIEISNPSAKVEHEATTSKIGEDQIFYCNQRGIETEDAVSMIVNGFCKEVFRELPMEFAIEAQKLLGVSLEGSVG